MPRDVLPTAIRIRTAVRECHVVMRNKDISSGHTLQTGLEFVGWVGDVYELGYALVAADAFVSEHTADRMAQLQAEMELELVGANAKEIQRIRRDWSVLKQRASAADIVADYLPNLREALREWAHEFESLHGKLEADMGSDVLLYEVQARRQGTQMALSKLSERILSST